MEIDQEDDIFEEMEKRKLVDISIHDSGFQFIAQVIHISDNITTRPGGTSFRRILLRDETAVIYAYLYDDHNLSSVSLELLTIRRYVRIAIPESMGFAFNLSNSVMPCNTSFCANCHPNRVIIVLRNDQEIAPPPPGFTIESISNCHVPFKFTGFEDIGNLEYGDVVDVLGVVRQIHWQNDEDVSGAWGMGDEQTPFRQIELTNVFPHNLPDHEGIRIRCTVWGDQYRKLNTVGTIVALKGAKVRCGWEESPDRNGLNIGNTCEIFSINADDEMWMIPDDMEEFYWELFPKLGEKESQENGSTKRKHEEVDLTGDGSLVYQEYDNFDRQDSTRNKVVDFTVDKDPLIISVKKATEFLDQSNMYREGVYSMRSNPRGLVLIINNFYFKKRPSEQQRKGSFHDERYMTNLFEQMGFQVDATANVRLDQFGSTISRFKSRLQNNPVDSVAVVIMSHGEQNVITLADENHINVWNDVVYQFRDEECPFLAGKPKLFFFQFCQEFTENQLSPRTRNQVSYSMRDTIVCFPTLPGTSAVRDKYLGSHFIYCLANVMMENAHEKDLVSMLHEVQELFSHKIIRDKPDHRQCYWIQLGFRKLLFFNPGLFERN